LKIFHEAIHASIEQESDGSKVGDTFSLSSCGSGGGDAGSRRNSRFR